MHKNILDTSTPKFTMFMQYVFINICDLLYILHLIYNHKCTLFYYTNPPRFSRLKNKINFQDNYMNGRWSQYLSRIIYVGIH